MKDNESQLDLRSEMTHPLGKLPLTTTIRENTPVQRENLNVLSLPRQAEIIRVSITERFAKSSGKMR